MLLFLLMRGLLRLARVVSSMRWEAEKMGDMRSHSEEKYVGGS